MTTTKPNGRTTLRNSLDKTHSTKHTNQQQWFPQPTISLLLLAGKTLSTIRALPAKPAGPAISAIMESKKKTITSGIQRGWILTKSTAAPPTHLSKKSKRRKG